MSKHSKLLARLQSKPKNFTWDELVSVLNYFGYKEITGAGSGMKFANELLDQKLSLHKPHPGNIVKRYVIDIVIGALIEKGLIEEED